ncbi:MAG TPA: hypothetical protein VH413_01500 [Verrucomicrobiae bacterium]|jgi:hypothetical protein|nr:hypothetical protein [Verrucomicrobiae bacterium]
MKPKSFKIFLLAGLLAASATARAQDTNAVAGTNAVATTNANSSATAASNSMAVTDFHSFDLISKRNIFDPTRSGTRIIRRTERPPRVDSFTLVGTMSYEQGRYAFFDSNSSEYRKTLKPMDKIAGYKITQIADDHIVLAASSNRTFNLPVGMRMRRQEGGSWRKADGSDADETSISTPSDSTGSNTAITGSPASAPESSGPESDVMKRMMMKRMSEK